MEPLFDPEVIAGLRALDDPGEDTFFREVMTAYIDTCHATRAGLDAAMAAGDLAEIRRLAHGLKGASLNIGSQPLARCCRELEDAARQGDLGVVGRGHEAFAALIGPVVAEAERMASGEPR